MANPEFIDPGAGRDGSTPAQVSAWPYPTNLVVLLNPDPQARRRVLSIVVAAFSLVVVCCLNASCSPLSDRLAKERSAIDAERLQPRMRELADAGSREAAIWLAQWYPTTDRSRLAPLVDAGDGHALFVLAQLARQDGKREDAATALQRSAAAGYPEAVALEAGLRLPGGKP